VDASDFGLLLDWKWGYGDGHLGRWHQEDLTEFLLGWCPRKLIVAEDDLLASVPIAAALSMSFLADRALLEPASDPVEELVEHGTNLAPAFHAAMTDRSNFGLSKSIMTAMGFERVDELTPEGVQRVMDDFNALPDDVRRAITDPAIGERSMPQFGPVRLPSEGELHQAAESSSILTALGTLADYMAPPGKVLTAKGNLKIADARALSDLLGTEDVYEHQIGDHRYRKRSSTQFVEVDFLQWLARECRAIRRQRNRLVAVKAWRDRVGHDPLAEVVRAFDVLLDYGVLGSYLHSTGRLEALLDMSIPALLGRLLQADEATDFEELRDRCAELAELSGIEPFWPTHVDWALDRALSVLERVGVLTQEDVVYTPARTVGKDRSGGCITLTTLGCYLAVHAVKKAGYGVDLLPPTEDMQVEDLYALMGTTGPERWWHEVLTWLSSQTDEDTAFAALALGLALRHPSELVVGLASVQEAEVERLAPIVGRLAVTAEPELARVSDLALSWMDQRGLDVPGDYSPDRLAGAHLDSWIAVATADDAESTIAAMRDGRQIEDQLALVQEVAARGHATAMEALDIIGRNHPDRAVAKAARKELFRLRSRG
jgi:hypothetical protein